MRFGRSLGIAAGALLIAGAGALPALGNNSSNASTKVGGTSSAACNDGTVSASPAILWPPNHKMQNVTLSYAEGDNDGDNISLSNINVAEADGGNPGEGLGSGQPDFKQGPDYSVPSQLPSAVPDSQVWSVPIQLRAERAGTDGNGSGRVYTISVQCNDSGGTDATETLGEHSTTAVQVCVPHDQSPASRAFCLSQIGQ